MSLVSPFGKMGPFGATAKVKKFEVVGIFDYGMIEYDSSISYVGLKDAMDFFDMTGQASGVEVKVNNIYNARTIGNELAASLGFPYYARNWEEVNKSLFDALDLGILRGNTQKGVLNDLKICPGLLEALPKPFELLYGQALVLDDHNRGIGLEDNAVFFHQLVFCSFSQH